MFILRRINKSAEDNIFLGRNYIYIPKAKEVAFKNAYCECFGCKFDEAIASKDILGFIIVTDRKIDNIDEELYPIFASDNSYIMTSTGETFCKLY